MEPDARMTDDPYAAGRAWFAEHYPELDAQEDNPAIAAVDLLVRGNLEFDAQAMAKFAMFAQEEVES